MKEGTYHRSTAPSAVFPSCSHVCRLWICQPTRRWERVFLGLRESSSFRCTLSLSLAHETTYPHPSSILPVVFPNTLDDEPLLEQVMFIDRMEVTAHEDEEAVQALESDEGGEAQVCALRKGIGVRSETDLSNQPSVGCECLSTKGGG